MDITIDLFGAARQLSDRATLTISVPAGATIAHVHAAIRALPAAQPRALQAIIAQAVFSTEDDILHPATPVCHGQRLAILPPVAGG